MLCMRFEGTLSDPPKTKTQGSLGLRMSTPHTRQARFRVSGLAFLGTIGAPFRV